MEKKEKITGDKWDSGKSLTCINWTFSSEREERKKCGRINTGTINDQEFSKTGKRYQPQIQEALQTQTRINKIIIIQTKTIIQTTIQYKQQIINKTNTNNTPRHILTKLLNTEDRKKILKAARVKVGSIDSVDNKKTKV